MAGLLEKLLRTRDPGPPVGGLDSPASSVDGLVGGAAPRLKKVRPERRWPDYS